MSNQHLDQFADAIANARAAGTFGDAEAAEQQLLGVLLDIAPELDHTTVGAAWLVIGNLFRNNLDQAPAHLQGDTAINLMNLVQLAGQRLYAGAPLTHPCPIPRSNGTACRFTAKGARQEVLDAMMRAHVDVYHPGATWPPEVISDSARPDWNSGLEDLRTDSAFVRVHAVDANGDRIPASVTVTQVGNSLATCVRCGAPVTVHEDGSATGGVDTTQGIRCSWCVTEPTEAGTLAQEGADRAPDRLTPEDWCRRYGFAIADPDGWRGPDDPDWDEPITLAEFIPRLHRSTARTPLPGELRMQRDLTAWQERRRATARAERSYTLDEAMAHPGGIDSLTGGAVRHGGFSVEGDDEQDEDGD